MLKGGGHIDWAVTLPQMPMGMPGAGMRVFGYPTKGAAEKTSVVRGRLLSKQSVSDRNHKMRLECRGPPNEPVARLAQREGDLTSLRTRSICIHVKRLLPLMRKQRVEQLPEDLLNRSIVQLLGVEVALQNQTR